MSTNYYRATNYFKFAPTTACVRHISYTEKLYYTVKQSGSKAVPLHSIPTLRGWGVMAPKAGFSSQHCVLHVCVKQQTEVIRFLNSFWVKRFVVAGKKLKTTLWPWLCVV